ncbi:hypothetical protein DR64_5497 [Paraburkholderia xenovorans LB400]|uniref:Transmembrane protein n=1 Tax=Paraburkholderia xenovorans (strain LB400) TaxID=266265 RepID=Q13JE8_PARXL|nr:hypothetical protein Bxe_B0147 [Paraburkholderia xenovorans LB400]AIP37280.1 hypothetical protein DR64_5497 [Paraburkholderia xenovorans LB400]
MLSIFWIQLVIVSSAVWSFFNDKMGRSPGRMALVGFFLCGTGIWYGLSIANFEASHLFSAEQGGLQLVGQLVNVVITAAGGNIIASALVLRAELASARARAKAQRKVQATRTRISELQRTLKFLELDSGFLSPESVDERRVSLIRVVEAEQKEYWKADKVLQDLGCESEGDPMANRKRSVSGRRY